MGGHEGVFVEGAVGAVGGGAHVDVAAVGDVDVAAEDAEEGGVADGGVVGDGVAEGFPVHVRGQVDAKEFEEGGGEVVGLNEGG